MARASLGPDEPLRLAQRGSVGRISARTAHARPPCPLRWSGAIGRRHFIHPRVMETAPRVHVSPRTSVPPPPSRHLPRLPRDKRDRPAHTPSCRSRRTQDAQFDPFCNAIPFRTPPQRRPLPATPTRCKHLHLPIHVDCERGGISRFRAYVRYVTRHTKFGVAVLLV